MRKTKAQKERQAFNLAVRRDVRKKTVTDFFLSTSKWGRAWLKEIAERYKSKGDFPITTMTLLPSYYEKDEDKEIAAFLALLVNDNERTLDRIAELRTMLGISPSRWFREREFVRLSIGSKQRKRTAGIENWKIARLFDRLWDECHILTYEIPNERIKETFVCPIGLQVSNIARELQCTHIDVLTFLLEDCGTGDFITKLRIFLLVLASSDGFGLGLWTVDPQELKCPIVKGLKTFLKMWFPDYHIVGGMDDAISLFGFERDYDFFYAFLGYKELQKRNPRGCSEMATAYIRWYVNGTKKRPFSQRQIYPPIDF